MKRFKLTAVTGLVAAFMLLFMLSAANSQAQGGIDPSFNPTDIGFGYGDGAGQVTSQARQVDGKIIIAGGFNSYNGITRKNVARLNTDGNLDAGFAQTGTGLNSQVQAVALQTDGKVIVGGYFTNYNGTATNYIARLNSDGTLDGSFAPTGTGLNGAVFSIAVQTDGKLIVGGQFTNYNGTSRTYIARLNADGTLDGTFAPVGAGLNAAVYAIAIQPDGKFIVGGQFSNYSGTSRNYITRLNSTGALDVSFAVGAGANGSVSTVALQADGKVLIGGGFTMYDGTVRNRMARLNSTGTLDMGFNSYHSGGPVYTFGVQADGKIIIGGDFFTYNGLSRNRIARLNLDGTPDAGFNPGTGATGTVSTVILQPDGKIIIGGSFNGYNGSLRGGIARINTDGTVDGSFYNSTGTSSTVNAAVIQPDGKIIICGAFISHNATARKYIARLNADGTIDPGFDPGVGADYEISTIALQPDGKILAGGNWNNYGGTTQRGIVRLNVNGSLDASFATIGTGLDGSVLSIVIQPDGKILIGGLFTSYNGTAMSHIARLNANGSLDASFSQTGTGLNFYVNSMALQPDGKVLIGGDFAFYNGISRKYIARLNANGTLDAGFAQTGTGLDGQLRTMQLQPDGKVIVGGFFNNYNGTARKNVARLNSNGTLDAGFAPTGTGLNNGVQTSVLQVDGKVIVGGLFTDYNGISRNKIARLNADGTLDAGFDPGTGANNNINTAVLQADGKLFIGGQFTGYNGTGRNRTARVLGDAPPPTITSFIPASGPVGTLVTITGTNLNNPTSITIGGTAAIVISNTGTQLVAMVMPGAITGTVSVTTTGGTANGATNFTVTASQRPNTQQGAKLVGTGNIGNAEQARSVSISADGNTALLGGYNDNSGQGAAWVYTRSGAVWTQQGGKLVGTGATGNAFQGNSVSLSADGNTAIVGGYADNGGIGAAWVYTRNGGVWTQQGAKLVGTGNTGAAQQGWSVSISADGNTAMWGGYNDNSSQGAAWIYTRSGGVWTQQGVKLVGTGNIGIAQQGRSVSLSADGNTAIMGGPTDNGNQGAVWVYTRSGGVWTQQGAKLVGTGGTVGASQGYSAVSLSADGNTAMVGAFYDNSNQGAAWVFTRSGGVWTQQGAKLVGTGNTGAARQGSSLSLSADGNIAIVGGNFDNSNQGAAWVYTRSGGVWTQQGGKLVGTGNIGAAQQGYSISLSADGNTAIMGGPLDNTNKGAAWVFTAASCTITLSSAAGTNAQTVCNNTPITNITYTTTDATGATFSGLPAGVTGIWAANTVTISGTPTAAGSFNYTVTLTGGSCVGVTATGSITVTASNTITLTSATGTDAQTVCNNTAITNITYATTGATGATFSGLPAGVTGSWAADVVTISGTPTASGTFNYTVTTTGGCSATAAGTITVNTLSVAPTGISGTTTICGGGSTVLTQTGGSLGVGAVYNWYSGSCGGTFVGTGNSITVSPTSNTTYFVRAEGTCNTTSCASVLVSIETTAPTAICQNLTVYLDAAGNATITPAQVNNGSGDACGIASMSLNRTTFSCNDASAGSIIYTDANSIKKISYDGSVNTTLFGPVPGLYTISSVPELGFIYIANFNAGKIQRMDYTGAGLVDIKTGVQPFGIDVDPVGGKIYWADPNANTISRCNLDGTGTQVIISGATNSDYSRIIKIDQINNKIYWTDANLGTVKRANLDGTGLQTLVTGQGNIVGLDLDVPNNKLYFSSYSFNQIKRANLDGTGLTVIVPAAGSVPLGLSLDLQAGKTYFVNGTGGNTIKRMNIDGTSLTTLYSGLNTPYDIATVPETQVILTVTDNSGNTSTCISTITVRDTTDPIAIAQNLSVNLNGAGTATISAAAVNNGSSDACGIATLAVTPSSFTCANIGSNLVTLTVTDIYGNVATATSTVTVNDTQAPTITCPANVTVTANNDGSCTATNVSLGSPVIADNCSATAVATFAGNPVTPATAFPLGNSTVVWTVTDPAGNTATCNQTVTVNSFITNVNQPGNQNVCNGANTAAITFSSTPAVTGTVYNWTNNTISIGLAASGTGNIASFTATNATASPVTATIIVTPVTNCAGSAGPSKTFTITVNPTPDVNQPADQVVCNNGATAAVNFTGSIPGTIFNWTNNTTSIGLATSGTGNIAAFTATNTTNAPVTATITVTPSTSGGGMAYITNSGSNNVSVINIATNASVGSPIPVGSLPEGIAVSPDGSRAYVVNVSSNNISVINTATNTVVGSPITVGIFPEGIAVSPDGSRVYVTNRNSNNVSVINTATNTVIASVPVGSTPVGICVSPNGSRVYVTNQGSNSVSVINSATNTVIGSPITVGSLPCGICITPDGSLVYIANYNSNSVSVINTATSTVIGSPIPVGALPFGINVTPNGSRVYVTNSSSNNVSVINTATNTIIGSPIPVGSNPIGICVTPDGSRVYVANRGANNLSVINTATNTVVGSPVTVASGPYAFGNFIAGDAGCSGTPKTFTITVNPTPNAVAAPSSQATCSGTAITTIALTGNVSGTVYNWTRNNGDVGSGTVTGIAASGSGNISGTLTNTTNAPVTVTFTVTPSFTNAGVTCTGTPITATVTVNPTPDVNQPANQVVCNNGATAAVNFSGSLPGTQFNWTNNTTSIGLAASGTGNIASFTATNATNAPVTATVTVTPSTGGSFAYITRYSFDNVAVINLATNTIVATVPVGDGPYGVSVSPDGSRVYVTNTVSNDVSVINTATNTVIATVPVGSLPFGISVSPDGSGVYVTNRTSGNVSVINTASNTVVATVVTGSTPRGVSVLPDGSRAYVANSGSGNVSVINTASNTVVATIVVGSNPHGLSVSPNGTRLYVANEVSNTISVINTATNTVVATVPVGSNPFMTAVIPDGSRVYVSNYSTNNVSVINTVSNTIITTVSGGFGGPNGVSVSPNGNQVYVANENSNNVTVINTATNTVLTTIGVGSNAIAYGNFITSGTTCTGSPKTFTYTINPTPNAVAAPSTQTICSGPVATIVLSGSVSGTVYNWTRNNGDVNSGTVQGIAASGSGDISGTLTNTTTAPVTVTFTITPAYTNAGVTCSGLSVTATVTVYPAPEVNQPADQVVCNNGATTAVTFSSTLPGTIFNWTNNTTSIGLAASGTGNIASFTATNSTNAPVTASVTVTPSTGGSGSQTFNYTGGIQTWTVPGGVTSINMQAFGAGGGNGYAGNGSTSPGGRGASVSGTFAVTPGEVFNLVVGGRGNNGVAFTQGGSGGGGSFVIKIAGTVPYLIAGGGGGGSYQVNTPGQHGQSTNVGGPGGYSSPAIGAGGFTDNGGGGGTGAGGGGWNSNGVSNNWNMGGIMKGGAGGTGTYQNGGFGGGGGTMHGGGGGGGYSGGSGGIYTVGAGGGGSYNIGTSPVNTAAVQTGNGQIIISYASGPACTGTSKTFTYTVNPTAIVNSITNQTVCNGASTIAVNFSSPTTGGTIVYNWVNNTPSIGLAGSGAGDIAAFTATNGTASPVTATITVTPAYTNAGVTCNGTPTTFTITVNPTSTITLSSAPGTDNQTVLINTPITNITYASTNATGATFSGLPAGVTGSWAANVVTISGSPSVGPGTYNYTVTLTGGCGNITATGTITVIVCSITRTSAAGTDNQVVCNNTAITNITYATTGATGATFSGLPTGVTGTWAGNVATISGTPSVAGTFNYTVTPTGGGCSGAVTATGTITVNPVPDVNQPAAQVVCNGAATAAITFSGGVAGTVFGWTNNTASIGLAPSGTGNIASFTATNSGTSPVVATIIVTPTYTSGGVTCTGAAKSFTITVNPTPTVNPVSSQVVCNGNATTAVNFSGAVAGTVFNWTNNAASIGLAVSGTGNIPSFTATNTGTAPVVATITVTPAYTNGGTTCTGTATTFTITVNPTPDVNQPASQVVCNGAATTAINFTGLVPGTVYNWTNNTTSIGLASSGTGNIASFTAINSGTSPVVANITVTPVYTNAGVTCTGSAKTFSITVNPTATVTAVAGQVVCNGAATTAVNFTSPTTGGTIVYNWTNNTTSIGLASGGSGNIASFNAINTGTAPVVATITVTPTYTNGGVSCVGTPITFTITVNPTATVNAVTNQVVCNGAATTAVTFTSPTTGGTIVYNWTNNTTSIGLASSGAGNIASFNTINTGTAPVVATITVTPTYTNGGVSCVGTPITFTITVNPTATVNAVTDQVVCNGAATTAVIFTSPTTGGTIVYNWTNNTTSIGLASSGTGNIVSFNAINTGTAPVVATITVTPTYSNGGTSCVGTPATFTITVNPTATVTAVTDQVVCNGAATTAVTFTSPTTGGTIVYNWTNNTTSIGLASSGSGDIASFNAINTGTAPVVATITVTPTYTNGGVSCVGTPITFTITVNPTATVNAVADQVVCNGAATTAVNFSSPATGGTIVYNWTNNTTSIGLASTGSGNIPSFNAINTGTAPVVATITVTPTYTNGGVSCVGTPITFTITVNPTATVNAVADQVVCNGDATTAIIFTSPATGGTIVYNWTNNTTSIGLAASGTGDIASFNAINTGTAPVVATITVTPTFTNGGVSCAGTPLSFTITVNPTATINAVPNQEVCNAFPTAAVNFSSPNTGGTIVYNWTNNTTSIGLAASGSGNIPSFTASNTTTSPVVATITVTPTFTNGGVSCVGTSISFTITVNPTPSATIAYTGSPYCQNGGTANVTRTGTAGGTYSATPAGLTLNATTGAVTLGTSTPGTYTVTYTIAAAGGCPVFTTTATITITATPSATISYAGSPYCSTDLTAPVTRTGTAGGTYSAAPAGLTINAATGTVTPNTSTPGTYTVTYSIPAGGGCAAYSTTTSITITQAPNATIMYTGTPYCQNAGTATVTRSGTAGGTYSATPAGLTLNAATGAVTLATSTPGTYTVTYTMTAPGCGTTITTTTITITATPAATISYAGSPYCSNGGTANVTRTGTAGGTYSSTAGLTINATTGAVTLGTSTPGTYTVTYTIPASGGCATFTTTATITITALPTATISYAGSPYCSNSGTATVTRTGTAGGTYTAAPAGLVINATTGDVNLATSTAGTYTVSYTIAASGGCAAVTATTSITINTLPAATISYAGNPYCQNAGTATVTRTGTAGGTYSATPAGLTINTTTGAVTLGTSTPGTYTVSYTIAASGGCAAVTATTSLTVGALSVAATAANASSTSVCGPTQVTLSVTGGSLGAGATWRWYSGTCGGTVVGTGATLNVTVSATTTYFVRAEGTCNTTTCASVTVTVNVQPTITLTATSPTSLMPGQTSTLTATVTPANPTNTMTWYRNGNVIGATGMSIVVGTNELGLYSVRTTTTAGCTALSNTVLIKDSINSKMRITPNPNNGLFKVIYHTSAQQLGFVRHVVIFAENGQKVFDQTYPITGPYSSMNVDVRHLAKGMYVVMLTDAFGREVLGTGKLVIHPN